MLFKIVLYFSCVMSTRVGQKVLSYFVNRHDRLLYYTLIERATFHLYNDAKIMPERNKYFEIDALKDTWGKTNGTFSRICEYYGERFMCHIFITTDQIFSNFTVINYSIFRKAM